MLQSGQNLGQFQIVKKLGAGGMGEVYLAEDTRLQRKVAIKILSTDYFEDTERRERFRREARMAAGISHANVMAIYDIGSAPDPTGGEGEINFIVMEYVPGVSLGEYLKTSGSDLQPVLRIAEHIASGLAAAHKLNIVHRDIKFENIIIDESGSPKILDFGLAKPVSPMSLGAGGDSTETVSQELTRAGKIIGTVSYMSPEQIRGEAVDSRSDIFSFGILLYRMATGALPFDGDAQVSTMAKILESRPEPPTVKNEHIPPELERIIEKCLEKNPGDRYQDTRDLVIDLRNLRRKFDSTISARTSAITDRPRPAAKAAGFKPGWKTLTAALVVIIVIAGLYWQVISRDEFGDSPVIRAGENALAILGFENKTGSPDLDWLQTGLPEILQTDLAQAQAMTIISRDRVIDCLRGQGVEIEDMGAAHEECLKAAGFLGARHALSGSFYKLGEQIRIDARLEDLSNGKIISTQKVVGSDPFALVDSLTRKIAGSLDMGQKLAAKENISRLTTSSPAAYKAYLEAMEKFDKRLYDDAIDDFKKAIELDSTFALPYMRIAMAHTFNNRTREGVEWFTKAKKYQDKLPNWDRTLLDIYIDLWLDMNYDDAFIKMELLVRNFPQNKESRYIYALLKVVFAQDTVGALAQLDTALQLDPHYLNALTVYSNYVAAGDDHDLALEYAGRARKAHPDSPTPYLLSAGLYVDLGDYEAAAREYSDMLIRFPANRRALDGLIRVNLLQRDFDAARLYLEQQKKYNADDPYLMADYYDDLAGLELWKGRFISAIQNRIKAIDLVAGINDSTLVSARCVNLGDLFIALHMPDSALRYSLMGHQWLSSGWALDYPLTLVTLKPELADSAHKIFLPALEDFKARIPAELWSISDGLEDMFNALANSDTAAIIDAQLFLIKANPGGVAGFTRSSAYLMALTGRYREARDVLLPYTTGEDKTSSAMSYLMVLYHLGLANEGLGNTREAAANFEEMLKYWGKPDIELKEIKDARQRLDRLTS